jgi:DNA-binding GntR family transcriptional regulator
MSASSLSKAEQGAIGATTAMRVAAELRRRVLHGEFAPGQRLKIDDIAALVDVSHMPVRVALQELEAEGVLDLLPHRGAVVRGVDANFVRNAYDVREAIEAC